MLGSSDSIILRGDQHRDLVAARLLEDPLQLAYCPLHCGLSTQVHFTDHDEEGHFQGQGQPQMFPCGAGYLIEKRQEREFGRKEKEELVLLPALRGLRAEESQLLPLPCPLLSISYRFQCWH